eukprot:scaffold33579_cov58-Phaeocystis_antarctica.AAC.6
MDNPLDCPVCLTLPVGEVHQCHNGHCYCVECWGEFRAPRRCPECRQALPQLNRNRAQEERIAALPAQCDHCAEATTRGAKAAHELACPQRPANCFGAAAGCGWAGVAAGQEAHEAACPLAGCQRLMAPLQALCAGLQADNQQLRQQVQAVNQQLRQQVAALEPLQAQNEQLQQRVAALEPLAGRVRALEGGAEEGGRRQRQRVGAAPHDAPPSNAAVKRMAVAAAVAALRTHVAVRRVAEEGCHRVACLCAEVGNRQPAVEAGALEAVVAALLAHPQVAAVQQWGCCALANVCLGEDAAATARKQRAVLARAPEAVMAAMQLHQDNSGVQHCGQQVLSQTLEEVRHYVLEYFTSAIGVIGATMMNCRNALEPRGVHYMQVQAAVLALSNEGHLYTTIDGAHYKATA